VSEIVITPVPLSRERFAPYGDVIAAATSGATPMNSARFDRFDGLATIDCDPSGGTQAAIGIVRSRAPTKLPFRIDMVERHPLGSQAFIPLDGTKFIVVVAIAGELVEPEDLHAFVTNGSQGVNYHRGTWHMPLIATESGSKFVVVDRAGADNLEERYFDRPVLLDYEF
jgi:ureidoglycolate lyase